MHRRFFPRRRRTAILAAVLFPCAAILFATQVRAQFGQPPRQPTPPRYPGAGSPGQRPGGFPGNPTRPQPPNRGGTGRPGRPGPGFGGGSQPPGGFPGNPTRPQPPNRGGIGRPGGPGSGIGGGIGGSAFQHVWKCSKCGRELGRGSSLLDKPNFSSCPHCGVQFINGGGIGGSRFSVPGNRPSNPARPNPPRNQNPTGFPGAGTGRQPIANNDNVSSSGDDEDSNSRKSKDKDDTEDSSGSNKALKIVLWTGGGLVLLGGAVGLVVFLVNQNKPAPKKSRKRRRARRIDDDYDDDYEDRPRSNRRRRTGRLFE